MTTCKWFQIGFFITVSISTIPKLSFCLSPAPEINQYQALLWMVILFLHVPLSNILESLFPTISLPYQWYLQNYQEATRKGPQMHLAIFETKSTAPPFSLGSNTAAWFGIPIIQRKALENVQKFGGRLKTQRWSNDYNSLCTSLNLKLLFTRRHIQKLKFCYKIVNNLSCIPASTFTPHPHPSPRLHHSKPLHMPFVSTITHKSSFFINIISHWNSLPNEIISCTSVDSFKRHLHNYFSLPA